MRVPKRLIFVSLLLISTGINSLFKENEDVGIFHILINVFVIIVGAGLVLGRRWAHSAFHGLVKISYVMLALTGIAMVAFSSKAEYSINGQLVSEGWQAKLVPLAFLLFLGFCFHGLCQVIDSQKALDYFGISTRHLTKG